MLGPQLSTWVRLDRRSVQVHPAGAPLSCSSARCRCHTVPSVPVSLLGPAHTTPMCEMASVCAFCVLRAFSPTCSDLWALWGPVGPPTRSVRTVCRRAGHIGRCSRLTRKAGRVEIVRKLNMARREVMTPLLSPPWLFVSWDRLQHPSCTCGGQGGAHHLRIRNHLCTSAAGPPVGARHLRMNSRLRVVAARPPSLNK